MKNQLAAQEEDQLAKEKLADIVKALKSASYQTLLAVGAFLTEKGERGPCCIVADKPRDNGGLKGEGWHRSTSLALRCCKSAAFD